MSARGHGIHLWVETASVPVLLWTLARHGAGVQVHAGGVTPRAGRLIVTLGRLGLAPKIVRHSLELGVPDENGRGLSVTLELRLLALADALPLEDCALPAPYGEHQDGLRRAVRSYYTAYMREPLILPVFAEAAYRIGRIPEMPRRVECLVAWPFLGNWTAARLAFAPGVPGRVRSLPSLRAMVNLVRILPGHPRVWLSLFLGRRPAPEEHVDAGGREQGTVLQQNIAWMFAQYPAGGHLYWHQLSGVHPRRVVLYGNRGDAPCDAQTRRDAEDMGFGWCDAAFLPDQFQRPVRDTLAHLKTAFAVFPLWPTASGLWRWSVLSQLTLLIEGYRALIRRHNAVAAYQSWVFLPHTLALALALRMEGGVLLWNFWSIHPLPVAQHHYGIADLVFAWGPYHRGFYHAHRLDYRAMFDVGIVMGDGRESGDEARSTAYRSGVAPEVDFVVTVLDTSYGREASNSLDHILAFYRSVLGLVRRNAGWGCIIKSKGVYDSLPPTAGLQDIVAALEAERRCLVVRADERVSVVAAAGDIAVCASINSAGFLAAAAGRRALHLDLAGLDVHPIAVAGGVGKVIFRDVPSFEAAVEAARSDTTLGDHSQWIDLIDPFRDGQGRRRVGEIVGAYMEARAGGAGREDAIDAAVRAGAGTMVVGTADQPAIDAGDALWRAAYDRCIAAVASRTD